MKHQVTLYGDGRLEIARCSCGKYESQPALRERVLIAAQAHTYAMYLEWKKLDEKQRAQLLEADAAQERAVKVLERIERGELVSSCEFCAPWCAHVLTGTECTCSCVVSHSFC